MKKIIFAGAFLLVPFGVTSAAVYMEYEPVKGETTETKSAVVMASASAVVGKSFTLDATKSIDDGVVGKFLWEQVSGPTVRVSNSTTLTASFVPPSAGTYVFDLRRTDSNGRVSTLFEIKVVASTPTTNTTTIVVPLSPPEVMKVESPDGEAAKKGNVEVNWKVEEGEKSAVPGVLPDEIDVNDDGEPVTPDFSILLGGGSESDEDGAVKKGREAAAKILLDGAKEAGAPIESISLNFEKIKTMVRHPVKLFGLIPLSTSATVEIDVNSDVKVRFPWWAVFASGKNRSEVGAETLNMISNILKTKHDTVKNSIGNIR